MPAREFFYSKELDDQQRRKFLARIERLADGHRMSAEQFVHEEDQIYALKIWARRIYCFQQGSDWFLTNGCEKKTDRANPQELLRAKRIRLEHLAFISRK